MENRDIFKTDFYKKRIELLKKDDFERTSGIRHPTVERYACDKTVSILVSRISLQDTLKSTRAEVSQNLDYGIPDDSGVITAKPLDLDLYREQQSIITDCVKQISAIDKAILALSELDAPFYSDLDADIHTLNTQLRTVNHEIENYTNRTDKDSDTFVKGQLKGLGKEKASLDNTLKIKLSTKEELDKILSTIEVD